MLVLQRKKDQKVLVYLNGELILSVTNIGYREGGVRLGFDAKKSVRILREEIVNDNRKTSP